VNENHHRHLVISFQYIDKLLSDAERIVTSAGSTSPFQEYSPDSTPVQRRVIQDYVTRVREAMERILDEQKIPRRPPVCGTLWAARGQVTFAEIAVAEIEPRHMTGYGPLSPADNATLEGIVSELNRLLNRIGKLLEQGSLADLQARLNRLERMSNEIPLLRELERIVTGHGLVEIRNALSLLLDRLDNSAFEIGVFGRVSSGKSSLLNHLLDGEVLPAGVTPVTAVPIRVSFGPKPQARIEFAESKPEIIELSRLAEFSSEQQNPSNQKHVTRISVEMPAKRLQQGVTFVDTPGLGSLATAGAEETVAYLPRCDLGIVLLDAGSALSQEDLVTIQALYRGGATAMVLVSKADLLGPPDRQRTVDYIHQQLGSQLGLNLPVRLVSVMGADRALCEEWIREDLMPLLDKHRELASVSIKRKAGVLREAILMALRSRLAPET
jgi:GTP-binding protein EngB required for normal cell division